MLVHYKVGSMDLYECFFCRLWCLHIFSSQNHKQMKVKKLCTTCNSRRFRKDPNGSLVCQNGHQLNTLNEVTEDGAALIGSQRKLRAKGKRKLLVFFNLI